jgi:hypothetical protein
MIESFETAGTYENPIKDSELSLEEALRQNPEFLCPPEILERQRLIPVRYFGLSDGLYHEGQIVVEERLGEDVTLLFEEMVRQRFPIWSAVPIADPRFNFDDEASMSANNTSGFNYRRILNKDKLSLHARGLAIDINPANNPCIHKDGKVEPAGAIYDPRLPGTLTAAHPIVRFLKSRRLQWGGGWDLEARGKVDYQHFFKELEE